MTATKKRKTRFPVFVKYTIPWLSEKTGYATRTLQNVDRGAFPANPRFRKMVSAILGKPEDELFGKPAPNGSRPRAKRRK